MSLADEKYIAFTTFKRDGTPVTTPTWAVPVGDDKIGFWTSSGSGKAKRLAHTSKVVVQPSNARGVVKPGTTPIEATAVLVTGPELEGNIRRQGHRQVRRDGADQQDRQQDRRDGQAQEDPRTPIVAS